MLSEEAAAGPGAGMNPRRAYIIECPRRRRILLVLPQVRRGILDGSTCPFGVLAVRGVYEPFLINAPRSVERHSH